MELGNISWAEGSWTREPERVETDGNDLLVTAVEGSDAWRVTSYGYVIESEHALVRPLAEGYAVEVSLLLDLGEQFDQAGLFLRASSEHWVKAGFEYADGACQLGAVGTNGRSDWSSAPIPDWSGRRATVRASRTGDAITIRACVDVEPWQFVRLLPMDPGVGLLAGPYLCAPTRAGLQVRFLSWHVTAADEAVHQHG